MIAMLGGVGARFGHFSQEATNSRHSSRVIPVSGVSSPKHFDDPLPGRRARDLGALALPVCCGFGYEAIADIADCPSARRENTHGRLRSGRDLRSRMRRIIDIRGEQHAINLATNRALCLFEPAFDISRNPVDASQRHRVAISIEQKPYLALFPDRQKGSTPRW